jgi:hypothetical protein
MSVVPASVRRMLLVAAAVTAAVAATSPLAAETGDCVKAKRRIAQEEKRAAKGEPTVESLRKARETCASPAACARIDGRLRALETRMKHHDARLARFKAQAAKACGIDGVR